MADTRKNTLSQLNKTTNPRNYPYYTIFNKGSFSSVYLVTTAGADLLRKFHNGNFSDPSEAARIYCQRRTLNDKAFEYVERK